MAKINGTEVPENLFESAEGDQEKYEVNQWNDLEGDFPVGLIMTVIKKRDCLEAFSLECSRIALFERQSREDGGRHDAKLLLSGRVAC